jgi:hypothetical protein
MEEFQDNEHFYKNLITILKLFNNRPHHLAKYLIESGAFDDKFIKKLMDSEKLNEIGQEGSNILVKSIYFVDIVQMTDYFNSFTEEIKTKSKSPKTIAKELNQKLDKFLKEEKYEDAIRIRDYMNKNNIKRIPNNNL